MFPAFRSLRLRLFLGIVAVSMLSLGILLFTLDQALHHTLQTEFDNVLLEKARTLSSLVEQSGPTTHFDFQPDQFPEFKPGPKSALFEVYLDGNFYQHSASLGNEHLPQLALKGPARPEVGPFTLPDGRRGRILAMAFQPLVETDDPAAGPAPKPLPQGLIIVAQESASLDRTLARLRLLFLALGAGATLLSGALLVWVASRTLRPLHALSQKIEALRETDLATTLSAVEFPTELAPIVERLNGLLHRLEAAFTRERAFTADVAHELRTPLAGILATLEVARSRPRDPAAYQTAIDKSLAILTQMQGLIENLLLLARADSGQLTLNARPVSLSDLLHECRAAFLESADRRHLHLELTEQPGPALLADREILRVVLFNLLDNAVCYAPPQSTITLALRFQDSHALIDISNPSTNLTPADLPTLLQRFVRKEPSRSSTGIHAGLGLSICQRLLTLQNGTLQLSLQSNLFTAQIQLPLHPPTKSDAP